MIAGETMFQYLKRQRTTPFAERPANKFMPTAKHPTQSQKDHEKTQRHYQKSKQQIATQRHVKTNQQEHNQSKTPRRNSIVEQTSKNKMRSFIQLISPIRNKSVGRQQDNKSETRQLNDKRAKMKDNYTKFMLQEKINLMRQIIENFIKQGRNLKQKARLLFIDMQPLLRHVEKCQEAGFERKTEQVRAKVKSLQSVLHNFKIQQSESSINQFYLYFCQHLNQVQGNAIAEISQTKNSLQNKFVQNINVQVEQLKSQKGKLQRQLSLLTKKYDKSERQMQGLTEQLEKVRSATNENEKIRNEKYENAIDGYLDQIQSLKLQNEHLRQKMSMCELQRKQAIFAKQKSENECLTAISKVKSEQQQFLLNQIIILKKEFSCDINKMSELHKIKEAQWVDRLKEQQLQIVKLRDSFEDILHANRLLEESSITLKGQNVRLKKHNDCLATDMHRINEQLYQHWLALKDIKTLSTRLDIFHKFKKIYDELLFNEQLFL